MTSRDKELKEAEELLKYDEELKTR